jgi:secreted Zn-dependent insulinase-like peptidase
MMKSLRLFVLLICLPIAGFASNLIQVNNHIVHSPNDHRAYRSITLPNQLQVLLISDPSADKEAAAMDVKVGSTSDPLGYEGLAHFLEHMLFLGTKKYPDPASYQTFISQHGGNHNAFTGEEETNFFFDIQKGDLKPALDRFSQQFISPTFTKKYVDRERNAVNSEYSTHLKEDAQRYFSVIKATLNEKNPYHRFAIGNLTTLSDKPDEKLRDRLITFYKNHYSANLMKLVILGREPLDTLQKWATEMFSAVPNRHLKAPHWTAPLFAKDALPELVQYKPIMNRRSLNLSFPIPSTRPYYKSKPTYYLSNLIGHEGKGSLLSYLKKEGLADALSAGGGFNTLSGDTFDINIALTEKGLAQWKKVMQDTFEYLHLLKTTPFKKVYFDESKTMMNLDFRFAEKQEAIHYVSQLASEMQYYPVKDAVAQGYMLDKFKPDLYKQYLSYMNPKNVQVSLVSPDAMTTQTTDWYQARYSQQKMPASDFPDFSVATSKKFHLPVKNDFIPDNTHILALKSQSKPTRIEQSPGFTAWYLPYTKFDTPKADIFINIRSPGSNGNVKEAMLTQLYAMMINDKMDEFGYPASLAGLSYQIYKHIRGISVKIGGWSDKQDVLLSKVMSELKDTHFSQERFNIFKEQMIRSLHNALQSKPYQQTNSELASLMILPGWSIQERLKALESVQFTDLVPFQKQFFDKIQVVTLSTGNLSLASALGINELVKVWLKPREHATTVPRGTILNLHDADKWIKTLKIDHPDSGYLLYLQGRNKSIQEQARYMLLAQILSPAYYENIRTENQLGYIVFASDFSMLDMPALGLTVESPNSTPERIQQKSVSFLKAFSAKLKKMKSKTFADNKSAVISQLTQKPNELRQLSNRLWLDIDRNQFNFNTREQLVNAVKHLKQKDFVSFYNQQIVPLKRALLIESTGSHAQSPKKDSKEAKLDNAALSTFKPLESKKELENQ